MRFTTLAVATGSLVCAGASFAGRPTDVFGAGGDIYNAVPLRAVFNEDARVVWFGDSFALGATWRVTGGSLLTWPFTQPLTAFATGDGRASAVMFSEEIDLGVARFDGTNGFRLYQTGPDADLDLRFAIPTGGGREVYNEVPLGPDRVLVEYQGRTLLDNGSLGQVSRPGVDMLVRPMFLSGMDGVTALPRRYTSTTDSLVLDPSDYTLPDRQIGYAPTPLAVTSGADGKYRFTLELPASSPLGYVQSVGFTAWEIDEAGDRVPGLAWSHLASNSWSYADFGRDLPAATGGPTKSFSQEQLEYWWQATTLDAEQPVFVFYYFAAEPLLLSEAQADIQSMVEQTEAAAAAVGVDDVHHCFVVPHIHTLNNGLVDPAQFETITDAAVTVATARTDMSVISIFHATDGVFFDGSQASQDWLLARGHGHFVYGSRSYDFLQPGVEGDLLDAGNLHPDTNTQSAGLFAWYAAQSIIAACPADFAAPYGLLDLSDLNKFVQLFVSGAFAADLVAPQGVIDLADVSAFIASFTAGCAE